MTKGDSVDGQRFDARGVEHDAGLVIEALAQGLCVCEPDGRIVLANQMYREFSSAIHKRIAELCKRASAAFAGDMPPGKVRQRIYRVHLANRDRSYEVVISPLKGSPGRVVALIRDTTNQERMRRKVLTIDRAGSELVRLEADAVRTLHVADRLKLLESKVVKFAHDLLNFDHFAIRVLNDKTNELELVMSAGLAKEALAIKLYAEPRNNGISGYVAATGKPYLCNDTSKDPLYVFGMEHAGSSLTVPLRLFDRVVGIFNVESNRTSAFNHHDQQFAEIFGRYIAMALHILNLLIVERYTTSQKTTGTVQGELSEPLNDLVVEAEALKDTPMDPEVARHVERIVKDVERIRKRIKSVSRGPQTLLGSDDSEGPRDIDPALEGKRILVVDNEEEVSTTIRDVLTRRGCQVTVCNDGASAMKLLKQWHVAQDPDQGFDLVFSDINIGDATGYDLFAAAKEASRHVPVILMTGFGYDPHHSIVRASQEGLQCVLFKPFTIDKMVEEVKRAVAHEAGGQPDGV
ncbi:MAG: response regulator [Phycisphaerae bacterium]|nr:response regulator [Phycisphaerae bacterium]